MNRIEPDHLAARVRELHGYSLDETGAARAADMLAGIAAALTVLVAEPQFHEEPASFALTLSARARPRIIDMAELTDLGLIELAETIRARRVASREATEAASRELVRCSRLSTLSSRSTTPRLVPPTQRSRVAGPSGSYMASRSRTKTCSSARGGSAAAAARSQKRIRGPRRNSAGAPRCRQSARHRPTQYGGIHRRSATSPGTIQHKRFAFG